MESGCEQILKITDRILDGGEITEEEDSCDRRRHHASSGMR